MGTNSSKDIRSKSDLYFDLLPFDLKCALISHIIEIRDLLALLTIDSLTNSVHECTREIRYGSQGYTSDLSDVSFDIDTILKFKVVRVYEVPIIAKEVSQLGLLGTHKTLREFAVRIPENKDTERIVISIYNMFQSFINSRSNTLDMWIMVGSTFDTLNNIAPFFTVKRPGFTSQLVSSPQSTMSAVYSAFGSYIDFRYMNGNMVLDPRLTEVFIYNNLLYLLNNGGNINGIKFKDKLTDEGFRNLGVINQIQNIKNIYMYYVDRPANTQAFTIFVTDRNIVRVEYLSASMPIKMQRSMQYFSGSIFSKVLNTLINNYRPRNAYVAIIYPIDSTVIPNLIQHIPYIGALGLYDNFNTIQELSAFVINMLQNVDVVYIFTRDTKEKYAPLVSSYPTQIVIID